MKNIYFWQYNILCSADIYIHTLSALKWLSSHKSKQNIILQKPINNSIDNKW